jgi:hypothetical protein
VVHFRARQTVPKSGRCWQLCKNVLAVSQSVRGLPAAATWLFANGRQFAEMRWKCARILDLPMNIEPLESRIAPASLTFTDGDGDKVVITTTGAGPLTLGVNVIVSFGQLQKLDLTGAAFQNANVSIMATRDPEEGGDGRVNVGIIDATGRDLGAVVVDGDLGQILAGSGTDAGRGLASLKVVSLGRFGTTTGATVLSVNVDGRLGALKVAGDVNGTFIVADTLGTAIIGGSLIGGSSDGSGLLSTNGDMGKVKVGGDLVGGAGNASGTIRSGGALAGVTVAGSLLGGANPGTGNTDFATGAIVSAGKLGPVKIGRDVRGDFGEFSGAIFSETQIVSVTIAGSLLGDGKPNSGSISTPGRCGPVTIKGDIIGGFGPGSGVVSATQDITSVTVGGSLIGGSGGASGSIFNVQGSIGPVKIGGNIEGSDGNFSGQISAGVRLVSATVGGSVLGGDGTSSGNIESFGAMGPVKIGRDVAGGSGNRSGAIVASTTLGAVTLSGSLLGGEANSDSGIIRSGGAMGLIKMGRDIVAGRGSKSALVDSGGTLAGVTLGGSLVGDAFLHGSSGASSDAGQILSAGAMGPVKISGDIVGGIVSQAGRIVSQESIASVTVGGSLFGNSSFSGEILSIGAMGPVKIGGDIRGNRTSDVGFQVTESGYIQGQRIASLFVGGSIRAGVDATSGVPTKVGSVRAVDDIGAIVIKGSLLGSTSNDGDSADGDFTPAVISARGQAGLSLTATNDVAIQSIKIGGRVERAQILAGYDPALAAKNADARIGAIVVGGDLIASSIVAGVATPAPFFGTAADAKASGAGVKDSLDAKGAVSKIASVVIKGSAMGTPGTNDVITFAIAAQQLGSLKVGGTTFPLKAGASNDLFAIEYRLGATRGATTDGFDFHAFEVA